MFACSESMETPARTAASTADFTVDNVEKVSKGQDTFIRALQLIHFNQCIHDDIVKVDLNSILDPIHKDPHLKIIYRFKQEGSGVSPQTV